MWAQGGGADDPDVVGRDVLQLLGEEAQTVPAPLHGGAIEAEVGIQAGGEAKPCA